MNVPSGIPYLTLSYLILSYQTNIMWLIEKCLCMSEQQQQHHHNQQ